MRFVRSPLFLLNLKRPFLHLQNRVTGLLLLRPLYFRPEAVLNVERYFMEPLDTDLEYVRSGPRPARPGSRFNVMLIIPLLGFLLVLIFIGAAVFQWNLSQLIDSLIGLFMVLFFVIIVMLFWAGAPRSGDA